MIADRKGDAASQFLNDVLEKVEVKIINMEQGFAMMKNEQKKERDNVGRMEVSTLKNNEDFRNVLNQI